MREWQSLSRVKWECKYLVVIVPKYRKKVLYGRLRREVGKIIRQLCRQKDVELIEGYAMPDHIHLVLSVPYEVQHCNGDGVSERQISYPHSPQNKWHQAGFYRKTFLVPRLLCQHDRLR